MRKFEKIFAEKQKRKKHSKQTTAKKGGRKRNTQSARRVKDKRLRRACGILDTSCRRCL